MKKGSSSEFRVRGHHFTQLEKVLARQIYDESNHSPVIIAQAWALGLVNRAVDYVDAQVAYIKNYGIDLVGPEKQHANSFFQSMVHGFIYFLNLPDTAWVQFDTFPDWICEGCFTQIHCHQLVEQDSDLLMLQYLQSLSRKLSLTAVIQEDWVSKGRYAHSKVPVLMQLQKSGIREIAMYRDPLLKIKYNRKQQKKVKE